MLNLKDYYMNDRAIELYNSLTNNGIDIDVDKLVSWLKEKSVAFKSNPTAWFIKVFPDEYKKGTFSRIEYVPASQPLFNTMRERGIVVKQSDCLYIDLLLTKICKLMAKTKSNEQIEEQIKSWLSDTIEFLVKKVKDPTSTHFIAVFKKSKSVNALGIDWEELQKEYEEETANSEAILLALEMEGR